MKLRPNHKIQQLSVCNAWILVSDLMCSVVIHEHQSSYRVSYLISKQTDLHFFLSFLCLVIFEYPSRSTMLRNSMYFYRMWIPLPSTKNEMDAAN